MGNSRKRKSGDRMGTERHKPGTWIQSKSAGVRYREHRQRMFKRQPDKYFAIRYQFEGNRIEEPLGWASEGMTVDEAAAIRGRLLQNIRQGKRPQSVAEMRAIDAKQRAAEKEQREAEQREAVTFGEMAELFLTWADENKKSARNDRLRYKNHLKRKFAKTPIRNISPFHLEKLKVSLKRKGLAPATIKQCLQLIRVIYNKTRSWGMHDYTFPKVDFPKVSNNRVAFLTAEQAKTLLDAIKCKSLMLWTECILSLYAGLRFGEIAHLELSDIDLDGGTIHIRDGKGGTRHAYITEPIQAALEEWWTFAGKNAGLIFPARPGTKYPGGGKQDRVSSVFGRTVEELGLNDGITDHRQKIVFHTLRHTFASWLVMGGESLQAVKELMGHKDIQTTMRYSHLAPDIKRNAVKKLAVTLNQMSGGKVVNLPDKTTLRG